MTGGEAQIRQAVTRLQHVFPSGAGTWAKSRFEEWVKAVINIDPDAVTTAAGDLIREWTDDRGRTPQPGHLVTRARTIERQMHDAQIELAREEAANGFGVAPAWYARLVTATVARSITSRAGSRDKPLAVSGRLQPYLDIANRYQLTTRDLTTIPPRSREQRVIDAHLAAERRGIIHDQAGPSGPGDLSELGGLAGGR